jgi:phage terminase large subunit GpA-like protein
MVVNARIFQNAAGLVRAVRAARAFLRPPPKLRPSEWAEQTIRIPIGNAVPGLIRFDNAPYQREVLDMTADPRCVRITLMWGAQTGKTQTALCAQGYRIAHNPVSQIMMQPSQGDLHTWLETKFNPLVESNERLQDLIAKPRGRNGVNNQRMKSYPGGFLMFSWSGSPKTMRGRSAPFIVCDETDGYDRTHEGHPVGLLWQRAATFGDQRLLLEISTPSIKGASWIEAAFLEGDQRYFHVACPHCDERQPLKWAQVTWETADDGEHRPETAGYTCRACGVVWTDGERVAAIRGGAWVATKPFRGHASYHLSELYSTFRRLQDIVQSFLDKKAAGDLQTFVNVSLAETWEEQGDQVDPSSLMQRVETFAAPVPRGGAVLTAGIDMQIDRLEVEVVAWGLGEESWSVEYHVLWGDPMGQDVWRDLDDLLAQTFEHETGAHIRISAACLDTGGTAGMTQAAYEYVRSRRGRRLFAIKGVGGWDRPIVTSPSRKRSGRNARPVDLFTVGVDGAKVVVQRRLQIEMPGPGYSHFPASRDPEWFAGMSSETLRTKMIKGFPVREWHQTRPRNEPFDCRVYALAALKILNPNIKRALDRLEADADTDPPGPDPEPQARQPDSGKPPMDLPAPAKHDADKQKPRRRKRRGRGGGWVNDW